MRITKDDTLLVKRASQVELDFYESLVHHPEFRRYTPEYCGVLTSKHSQGGGEPGHDIVLVNAAHAFRKPNVIDLKMGQRLWTDAHDAEKIKKFKDRAAKTTSQSLGFVIQGMGTWTSEPGPAGKNTALTCKIVDKKSFRFTVTDANVGEILLNFFLAQGNQVQAIEIIIHLLRSLRGLEEVLKAQRSRMVGSSILFIYEGDRSSPVGKLKGRLAHLPVLKMIDFSYANWTPLEESPDANVLFGVRKLVKILQRMRLILCWRVARDKGLNGLRCQSNPLAF